MTEIQEIDGYSEFLDLRDEGKLKEDVLYLIKGHVPMEEETNESDDC